MAEPPPSFTTLVFERLDTVARIILNRPPVNAVTRQLAAELNEALRYAGHDDTIRAVIVTGAGERAFCAGVDLVERAATDGLALRRFLETFYAEMVDVQAGLGKPTIAALNGPALGGGVTIAVACDLIIASDRARLGYPEINVGTSPAIHLVLLPRVVGKFKAFELCFSGEPIDAFEAQRLGLVNAVVPHDRLQDEALALAQRLAAKPPLAVRYMREVFYRSLDVEFRKGVRNAIDLNCLLRETEDASEGMRAFNEKRPPRWVGR